MNPTHVLKSIFNLQLVYKHPTAARHCFALTSKYYFKRTKGKRMKTYQSFSHVGRGILEFLLYEIYSIVEIS